MTVKKVRLKMEQNDSKIMREVNALSQLNHRFIVRYYTTWIETTMYPLVPLLRTTRVLRALKSLGQATVSGSEVPCAGHSITAFSTA